MKKVIFFIVLIFSSVNLFGQINTDSLINHIVSGINEKRDKLKIPQAKLDDRLSNICSELIDLDIKNNGKLNEEQSYKYINPKTGKIYAYGDVRYSYIKLDVVKNYYVGIENQISEDFFGIYNEYNNGEYFVINSKNFDMSNGVCHLGISARMVNKQIYLYFIILSETKDDFVYQP